MIETNVLRIYTIPAKLDISTVRARLSAKYVHAHLDIEKSPCYLDMHSKNIRCEIDSSACRAEEGLKSVDMLTRDFAEDGLEALRKFTHETAVLGQAIVHAGKHENVIKEAAKQKVKGEPCHSGIKFIPSVRPKIIWHENELDIEAHTGKVTCNWDTTTFADVELEQAPSISITEVQKPEIHIEYVGSMFNTLDIRA